MSLRLAWFTELVLGQPGLHREKTCLKKERRERGEGKERRRAGREGEEALSPQRTAGFHDWSSTRGCLGFLHTQGSLAYGENTTVAVGAWANDA